MQEHHIDVIRTARYFTLGASSGGVAEVWFVLHGYGQLAERFLHHFEPLDNGSRLIVAPEGLSRFYLGDPAERPSPERKVGAAWMTHEDRLAEIGDYVRYCDAVCADVFQGLERGRVRVGVLGFSQGAATACRWLAQGEGAARAERLVLWGGEIPPDLDLNAARERFSGLDLTLVAGQRDQLITSKIRDRDQARLDAHGIPFRAVTFDGGHEMDPEVLRQVVG